MLPGMATPMLIRPAGLVSIATWNPADVVGTLSSGNLRITAGISAGGSRSTVSRSTGKGYFELTVQVGNPSGNMCVGVATSAGSPGVDLGSANSTSAGYRNDGRLRAVSATVNITVASYTNPDVVSIAVDVSNHLIWWAKNGTWLNSGNPASGTNGVDYGAIGTVFAAIGGMSNTESATANFGATPFTYTPPSGFQLWG